jgi:GPR1/FUN34/yaaH family protein
MEASRPGAREADVAPPPDPTAGKSALGWTPADPGPLGLAGFAGTTFVLSMINAGLVGDKTHPGGGLLPMVAALAIAYGGIAHEERHQRDDQARGLRRSGHGDRRLVRVVRGGHQLDLRADARAGLPAEWSVTRGVYAKASLE